LVFGAETPHRAAGHHGRHLLRCHRAGKMNVGQPAQPRQLPLVQPIAQRAHQRHLPIGPPRRHMGQQRQVQLGVDAADDGEGGSGGRGEGDKGGEAALEGVDVHGVGHVVGVRVEGPARVHQALRGAEDQIGAGAELAIQIALALRLGQGEARVGAVLVHHVVDDQSRAKLIDPVLLAGAEEPEEGGRIGNWQLGIVNWQLAMVNG